MFELLKTIQVVGLQRMLKLLRAYRLGWQGIISGYYTTRTMQALFNIGFFDELQEKGTVNLKSFAERSGLDASILRSMCDSLFALSILKKSDSNYSLDSKGRILVEVARGWFDGVYGYEEVFHSLEALLRKEKVYGRDVTRRLDFIARGSGEMEKWIYFPLAIATINTKGFKKVLDLGCGEATFLRNLCESNDKVTGYGIDIAPEAISLGREKVAQAGLQDRIHLFVENISKLEKVPDPLGNVDVATTFFVLHEILFAGSDRVVELLRSFRRLFPGVPLIVFEAIRPTPEEARNRPGMAIQYVLQHDLSNQRLVSGRKWQELFKMAGFNSIEERYLPFARTGIYTLR
jgi:ubiquinone/menaquinone biosynthesis C-methylase UbiE